MKDYRIFSIVFMALATVVAYTPLSALAQDFASVTEGVCNVVQAAQSGPVKALLVIIVLFMGVGAFFGKVNWGLVVMVTAGIAGALGAAAIARIVTGANCDANSAAIAGDPTAPK